MGLELRGISQNPTDNRCKITDLNASEQHYILNITTHLLVVNDFVSVLVIEFRETLTQLPNFVNNSQT
jgi:hypothetical protein